MTSSDRRAAAADSRALRADSDPNTVSVIIIIMEICKAPTLQLNTLNKHSITHIMYDYETEMLSAIYIKFMYNNFLYIIIYNNI